MSTIYDGQPLNTTTVSGSANSVATSSTGWWDVVAEGTQGAWIDFTGSSLLNASSNFNFTNQINTFANRALRPTGEAALNTGISLYLSGIIDPVGNNEISAMLRYTPDNNGNCYFFEIAPSFNVMIIGTFVADNPGPSLGLSADITGIDSSHDFRLDCTATGSNPTALSMILTDLTTDTVVATISGSDSTSQVQVAGVPGVTGSGGTEISLFSRIVTNTGATSPSFAVSPTTDTNAQSVVYTLTGSNTSWTSGTTFSISGVTGASITSQSIAGQVGTVTVLLDNTHTGTLTFTDSTDSATATSAVTLAAPGIPQSPSASPGNMVVILNWLAPSSGGLTATYNVYRGTTPGGESGTPIVTGVTSTTYTDTGLTNGQIYYYKIAAVNATGTGTHSSEVSATPAMGAAAQGGCLLMITP